MKFVILLCIASAAFAFPDGKWGHSVEVEGIMGFMMPRQLKGVSPNIVGGSEAAAHAYPYQVSLQISSGGSWYHSCGGSIVEADKIITAAHCVVGQDASKLRVVAGDHDLTAQEGTEQISSVAIASYHPRFDMSTVDFDYAVIRLSAPLTLNENVATIALPTADYVPSGDCVNTGWGNTRGDGGVSNPSKLQQVTLPSVSREDCAADYAGINEVTDRMICAGSAGKGPCNGDSGGPIVCNGVLAGSVSWGVVPCAQSNYPGVYANIAPALGWFANQ